MMEVYVEVQPQKVTIRTASGWWYSRHRRTPFTFWEDYRFVLRHLLDMLYAADMRARGTP